MKICYYDRVSSTVSLRYKYFPLDVKFSSLEWSVRFTKALNRATRRINFYGVISQSHRKNENKSKGEAGKRDSAVLSTSHQK